MRTAEVSSYMRFPIDKKKKLYNNISIYIYIYLYILIVYLITSHVAQQIKFDSAQETAVGYQSHFLVDIQW